MTPALRGRAALAAALCVASTWGLGEAVYTPPISTINVRKKFWRPSAGPASVLKIGTPVTLSVDARYANLGGALFNAWILYFDWLNRARGGIQVGGTNYSVELVVLDDVSSKDTVEWATNYLIQQEGVSHFLGPYSSGLTGRMSPLVQAAGKVAIAPGASLTSVFQPNSNVFGTLTPNVKFLDGAMQAVGAADGNSRKTLMYLAEDLSWTNSTCGEVPRLAGANNMQLLGDPILVPVDANVNAMSTVVATLMLQNPDVLVSCVYRTACHSLLKAMEESRYTPKALIMTICVTQDDFMSSVGQAGKYAIGVSPWMPSAGLTGPVAPGWTGESFSAEYTSRFGAKPPYQAASSFVAAATLVYAIETAGSVDPAAAATVLRNMDQQSMYGQISFDANGQCRNQMQVLQYDSDVLKAVYPPTVATRSLIYPKPDWASLECFNTQAYSDSRFGFLNGVCRECPLGRMSTIAPSAGRRECRECTPGQMGVAVAGQAECIDCPTGTFSAEAGSLRCHNCPAGSFGNTTTASSCIHCPAGTASEDPGASFCSECSPGYYQRARGKTQCERCEKGRYGELRASTACQDCPPTFTTDGTGYRQASECGCPAGFFNGSIYDASRSPSCEPCARGLNCPGFFKPVILHPGYYEAAAGFNPFRGVWECFPASKCPGGPPGTCASELGDLGCSICPDGKVLNLEELSCQDCHAGNAVLMVFCPFILLVVLAFLYYQMNGTVGLQTSVLVGSGIMGGQAITTFQVIGMLGRLSVPWPASLHGVRDFAKVFTTDGDALALECMVGQDPLARYITIFSVPMIAVAALGSMTVLSRLLPILSHGRLQAWSLYKVFNTICHSGQTIFITITVVAASPMQCQDHPNGKWTVVSFPDVRCFDGDKVHDTMMSLSVILLVLIVFPFIAVSAWGTYSIYAATQLHGTSAPQLKMYRYLIYRFRPSLWWYGNVFNLKQLLLGLTPLITPDDVGNQLVYALLVLLSYLVLSTSFRPWRTLELNFFDALSCGLVMSIGVVMMTFIDRSPNRDRQVGLLVTIVVFTLLVIGLGALYCLLQLCLHGWSGEYGFHFPLEEEMEHFSDHCQAAFKKIADIPNDKHRKLMQSMSTGHRLEINRVLTILSNCANYGSEFQQNRVSIGNFQKVLRLVAPEVEEDAKQEEVKEEGPTLLPVENVVCVEEKIVDASPA